MSDTTHLIGVGDHQPRSAMPTHCPPSMLLSGDGNTPAMPMTDAQVNHLRRLLAWIRVEYMLDPDAQRGYVSGASWCVASGHSTPEEAGAVIQQAAEKINHVPAYVRQGVKMLTKALRDHERVAGIVDEPAAAAMAPEKTK